MQSLHRGPRDVFHLGHGDEIAEVPQFHCTSEGMPSTHAEARNIVFPTRRVQPDNERRNAVAGPLSVPLKP